MDLTKKSVSELKALCKEKGYKGYSTKKRDELIALLGEPLVAAAAVVAVPSAPLRQEVRLGDCLTILKTLEAESAQIILADPP